MATSIEESFSKLRQNLEISDYQKTTVSIRQQGVREVLEREVTLVDSFLTGSYARHTLISPLKEADVDIFVVLDAKYFYQYNGTNGGQAGLLDFIKRILLKTYTRTPSISRNGQAITIAFSEFKIDVVPAFNRKGGGYLIPNANTQKWIETDPKVHVRLMSDQNAIHNDDLIPLIKMIKGWNREVDNAFHSFYLELIAIDILKNVTITNFSSGMLYFFEHGREKVKYTATDPAGYGSNVQGLNTLSGVTAAVNLFQNAYSKALAAEFYSKAGEIRSAIEMWQKIFGKYFPSYGYQYD
jgi:hypothetical protein